ncbi:MAG: STAS domain-containing protein [Bacteroidota bacterium]
MSSFSVGFRSADNVQILDLRGELDAHTASELEAAFNRCRQEDRHNVVVNGSGLQYISSAGLGVFMAYIEDIRERGGDIKIAELQPKVFNVFDLLGFPLLFEIVSEESEALARFSAADQT